MSQKVIIPAEVAGGRLDVVAPPLLGMTRSQFKKSLEAGLVALNGKASAAKVAVRVGDEVVVTATPEPDAVAAPHLNVLYEDDDIMVVDKPAGLVVHATESGRVQPTVADFARNQGVVDEDADRPGIVHRLDKETSGALAIAKNLKAKAYLQQQFKQRLVHKKYLALVRGRLELDEATIELPIGRSRKQPTKRSVVPGSRASTTHYLVKERLEGYTLVEVELETGRTHQIRVHFAHLGHPVLGDSLYGGPTWPGLERQWLHAAQLSFTAPSGRAVEVDSPLPADLEEVLTKLRQKV